MPDIYYDGDFTVAQIAGPPEFIIPFATDPKPYGYKLKYWQFLNNFEEPALGTAGPLGGGYVGGSPGTFKSIGGGVIEFEREYANVPDSRSEFESFVYAYPIIIIGAGGGIQEMPLSTHSRIQFDYFATTDPNSIDLPRAPHAVQVINVIYLLNGLGDYVCPPEAETGTEVLAQDATIKIWKPGIYERQQRFVRWIKLTEIFANSGCP